MKFKAYLENLRKNGWTVKIVPKTKTEMSVFHFTSIDLLRVGFIAALSVLIVVAYLLASKTQEIAALNNLQTELKVKDNQLNTVQEQKAVVEALLNQKAAKLESHLADMRKQEEKIRKLLGVKQKDLKPLHDKTSDHSKKIFMAYRFANKSSRGSSYQGLVFHLASLQREIGQEELKLADIKEAAVARHEEIEVERKRLLAVFDHIPTAWPAEGLVTSGFGYRTNPVTGGSEFHPGVDIATQYGSSIHAAASGVCIFSGWAEGFGYTVRIDHGNGLVSQYSHCSRLFARQGEQIKKGELIALVGSTGFSTGSHVHYGLFDHGRLINPYQYLGLTFDQVADREIGLR